MMHFQMINPSYRDVAHGAEIFYQIRVVMKLNMLEKILLGCEGGVAFVAHHASEGL